jgi:hypothetical protein
VLVAAQGHYNGQIADELGISVDTVRLWRDRWVGLQGVDLETDAAWLSDYRMLPVLERLQSLRQNNVVRWQHSRVRLRSEQDARSVSGQDEKSTTN